MRLFWRDHLALIVFTAVELAAAAVVFWLDGYRDYTVAAYAMLLGACVFLAYLAFRWFTHRRLYEMLAGGLPKLDESVRQMDPSPLSLAVGELLESQYRHYRGRIIESERKQRQHITFMNHWVHQMKTPLSVLELMLQDGGQPRDESMLEETDRLRKGLEMVLYMARLETFEQDFRVDKVGLREAVNEVILDNRRLFIRSAVYPVIDIPDELQAETDGKWLRFILQQLISNAVKYSAGIGDRMIVRGYADERAVKLEVADFGAGIPAADLPRVFQPFFTGENGREFKESTGMGLYIAKTVLDRMNHSIAIESAAGQGTVARITFPFAAR